MNDQTVQVDVETLSSVKRKLTVSVPVRRVATAIETAYEKLQRETPLKGFRKGKVPRAVLEQHYSALAQEEAMNLLVRESYPDALARSGCTPVSHPTIEPEPLLENAPFRYAATIEVRPVVTVKGWEGLVLEREPVIVDVSEVEHQLSQLREGMTKLVPVAEDVALASGMVARVDFSGTADGKPFEGSETTDFMLEIGSGNVLPEFEQPILGMKVHETRQVTFRYPDDYFNLSLAGSQAVFTVTVKEVKQKSVPEANDDLAKELGDYQTIADVRAAIEQQLTARKEQAVRMQLGQDALRELLARNDIEVPESMVARELQYMFQHFQEQLQSEGRTIARVGVTPETFAAEHEARARTHVRERLLLDALATEHRLTVREEAVESRLKQIAESSGEALPKVRLHYEQHQLIDGLKTALLHEKALDFVLERAKIKIKKAKKRKKGEK